MQFRQIMPCHVSKRYSSKCFDPFIVNIVILIIIIIIIYIFVYCTSFNVVQFGRGKLLGAVNGMKPNGAIDSSCLQSREVRHAYDGIK
jgi:hypothetical protein